VGIAQFLEGYETLQSCTARRQSTFTVLPASHRVSRIFNAALFTAKLKLSSSIPISYLIVPGGNNFY
jgi:hypothetical protein